LQLAGSLPQSGDRVFAIGSPKGLAATVTDGIVSEIRDKGDIVLAAIDRTMKLIQHTVAIKEGSSGGPLCAASGRVLGINTFMKDGDSPGIPFFFAISAEELRKLIDSADGNVRPLSELPRRKKR
jgi:S1-C subfamily serine protease